MLPSPYNNSATLTTAIEDMESSPGCIWVTISTKYNGCSFADEDTVKDIPSVKVKIEQLECNDLPSYLF